MLSASYFLMERLHQTEEKNLNFFEGVFSALKKAKGESLPSEKTLAHLAELSIGLQLDHGSCQLIVPQLTRDHVSRAFVARGEAFVLLKSSDASPEEKLLARDILERSTVKYPPIEINDLNSRSDSISKTPEQ
jgi:hypothetical protein